MEADILFKGKKGQKTFLGFRQILPMSPQQQKPIQFWAALIESSLLIKETEHKCSIWPGSVSMVLLFWTVLSHLSRVLRSRSRIYCVMSYFSSFIQIRGGYSASHFRVMWLWTHAPPAPQCRNIIQSMKRDTTLGSSLSCPIYMQGSITS